MTTSDLNSSLPFDPTTERGMHNPLVIDLIAFDPATEVVTLKIVQSGAWDENSKQSEQFQEKLNNYLDYVLDGYLANQYPNYSDKQMALILSCSTPPTGKFVDLFNAAARYLESIGWTFSIEKLEQLESAG